MSGMPSKTNRIVTSATMKIPLLQSANKLLVQRFVWELRRPLFDVEFLLPFFFPDVSDTPYISVDTACLNSPKEKY